MTIENYCFCELAPLYVLGLLSDLERDWVEQQLVECPELTEELAQYEMGVGAIPYTAPVMPMAVDLKERLFDVLKLEPQQSQPNDTRTLHTIPSAFLTVRSQDIQWLPHSVPGVEIAIFYTDLIKREVVGLFRAEPGRHYPIHRHAGTEEIYMLSGDLIIEDEVYGPGDYIHSQPRSVHGPHTINGCLFFFRTSIDDEFLDGLNM